MPGTGPGMTGVRDLPKPLQHANFRPRRADAAGAVARVIPNKPVPELIRDGWRFSDKIMRISNPDRGPGAEWGRI